MLALIDAGGPFKNKRDGISFSNRERVLPKANRGYYREYTVRTPAGQKPRRAAYCVRRVRSTTRRYVLLQRRSLPIF